MSRLIAFAAVFGSLVLGLAGGCSSFLEFTDDCKHTLIEVTAPDGGMVTCDEYGCDNCRVCALTYPDSGAPCP